MPRFKNPSAGGGCVVAFACLCTIGGAALAAPAGGLQSQVETRLRLHDSVIAPLEVDTRPGVVFQMTAPLDGVQHVLHLWPHSTRAPGYQVLAQVADGSLIAVEPGPVRTVRGVVVGQPESWIAGATDEHGFSGTIVLDDGRRFWIESLAGKFVDAGARDHAIYRAEDAIAPDGICGNPDVDKGGVDDEDLGVAEDEFSAVPAGGGTFSVAELACDADVQYFNDYGSIGGVEDRINLVTNAMNPQYETQVGISHLITTIIVRTAEPDPYSSSQSGTLLCQFITEWTNNQQSIDFDVAKLFTGREISGGTIGQAANFGEICDRQGCCSCAPNGFDDGAFCYSQSDCCGGLGCATDLMAHELGHLWDAVHCSCTDFTMNSFITCANQFSSGTISDIVAHRNSRTCLEEPILDGACCLPDGSCDTRPAADCSSAGGLYFGDGSSCASTQCPDPTGACCLTDGQCVQLEEATCSAAGGAYQGNQSDCGGVSCPQPDTGACCFGDGSCTVVAPATCANAGGTYQGNDVTCGAANCPQSDGACCFPDGSCTVETEADCASAGGAYEGTGISCAAANCPSPPTCPADLDGDLVVGFNDLLSLLSSWGPCPGCPADLDGDLTVGFNDLLSLLSSWGPCE